MMKSEPTLLISTLALTLTLFYGCGYHFFGHDISLPTQSRKIAIPTFYNDTFEPLIEKRITGFVKEEFISNGILQVVNDPAIADLTLTGRITGFGLTPISFTADNSVAEYRVSIKLDITLSGRTNNPSKGDMPNVLAEKGREITAEYRVTDDVTANRVAEDRAIDEAGKLFAEDLVSQILEGL